MRHRVFSPVVPVLATSASKRPGTCSSRFNPKTPKPQFVLQNLSEIKKCEINICVPSKRMALYNIIIIAQPLNS